MYHLTKFHTYIDISCGSAVVTTLPQIAHCIHFYNIVTRWLRKDVCRFIRSIYVLIRSKVLWLSILVLKSPRDKKLTNNMYLTKYVGNLTKTSQLWNAYRFMFDSYQYGFHSDSKTSLFQSKGFTNHWYFCEYTEKNKIHRFSKNLHFLFHSMNATNSN